MNAEKNAEKKKSMAKEVQAMKFDKAAAAKAEGVAKQLYAKMKKENEGKVAARVAALKKQKEGLKSNMESAQKQLKTLRSNIAAKKKQMAEYVASRSPKAKALGMEIAIADKAIAA